MPKRAIDRIDKYLSETCSECGRKNPKEMMNIHFPNDLFFCGRQCKRRYIDEHRFTDKDLEALLKRMSYLDALRQKGVEINGTL